jgi:hypothetical protein
MFDHDVLDTNAMAVNSRPAATNAGSMYDMRVR